MYEPAGKVRVVAPRASYPALLPFLPFPPVLPLGPPTLSCLSCPSCRCYSSSRLRGGFFPGTVTVKGAVARGDLDALFLQRAQEIGLRPGRGSSR